MAQFVSEFQQRTDMLADAGIIVPRERLSIMLLSCLPEEFENFRVAIESRDEIPEISVIKAKLVEEDARRGNKNNGNSEALYSRAQNTNKRENPKKNCNTQNKFLGKCFKCGKVGHRASDCRTKLPQNKAKCADTLEKSKDEAEDILIATTAMTCQAEKEEWCIDSGATVHMCKDKNMFEKISDKSPCSIRTAGKSVVMAYGSGRVNLNISTGNTTNRIVLSDVLYAPGLRNNLISVPAITNRGYSVTFGKKNAVVSRGDSSILLTAPRKDRMYVVKTVRQHSVIVADGQRN